MENMSPQINELATALAKAQGEMPSAELDKVNPHFKSRYATLDSIWKTAKSVLSKYGLSVVQTMDIQEGTIILITHLIHSSGQWVKSTLPVIAEKSTPQAMGSALSYAKRYSLSSMVGCTGGDDDDGNAAQAHQTASKAPKTPEKGEPVEYIIGSKANELERLIEGKEHAQYRADLLKYFGEKAGVEIKTLFTLPVQYEAACVKSIEKRLATVKAEKEEQIDE